MKLNLTEIDLTNDGNIKIIVQLFNCKIMQQRVKPRIGLNELNHQELNRLRGLLLN